MYVGGMSSSLPEDVQAAMYHSVAGLEQAKIVKNAYAIEYDCINTTQLNATLEFKAIRGLFSGGQFNAAPDMRRRRPRVCWRAITRGHVCERKRTSDNRPVGGIYRRSGR